MKGWSLFNDRCNNVNPLYIKTRNQHLYLGSVISGDVKIDSSEKLVAEIKNLSAYASGYLDKENQWLNNQEKYLNRWDFKLLEPEYVKRAGNYQLLMYQAQYNYYKTVSDFFAPFAAGKQEKPSNSDTALKDLDKYAADMQNYRKLYFDAMDTGVNVKDWRKIFAQVPEPNCPEENLI